jgi:outer membrane biosynthesis protein TonB
MRNGLGAGLASVALAAGVAGAGTEVRPAVDGDRPLRIIKDGEFEFPPRLLAAGIRSGEVRLLLHVDAHGELTDHLFVAFTHHEFANEMARTVPRWRFEPTIADGRPIACTVVLNVRFTMNGMVVLERHGLEDAPVDPAAFMFRARELRELDQVPPVVFSVVPPNPVGDDGAAITGRARVEFYIDERGDVRMPVVADADDERLGWVAAATIAKWQFEVPRRGGHPVLARASQVFVFRPDE